MSMENLTAASNYVYEPLDNVRGQIRLLTIPYDVKTAIGRKEKDLNPLTGSLKRYYLPLSTLSRAQRIRRSVSLPLFLALSYVWGDPTRTREITIDGKKLGITENLYHALRDLQRAALFDINVWADAICICQDDLAERSVQVLLMREIYHTAADVKIWLGPGTKDSRRCLEFIDNVTGFMGGWTPEPDDIAEDDRVDEKYYKAIMKPTSAFLRGAFGFAQTLEEIGDIIEPSGRDDRAEMLLDCDGNLSLHQETIQKLVDWCPKSPGLEKIEGEDFIEIASLIEFTLIQNCAWFERMWVVQEIGATNTASILFGGNSVEWESFLKAVYYLHYNLKATVSSIRMLTGLEKIRQGWLQSKRQPLRDLIRECRYRRATDPRDKVFALLGLMGDKLGTYLSPDYSKSVSEVYANVAFHFIAQVKSLDPICGWQILGRQEQLPSWTPDYNLNQDLAASPIVSIDGRESIYSASGHDHRSIYAGLTATNFTHSWSQLRTIGLYIDSVAMISSPCPEDEPFGTLERMWHSTISASGGLLQGFTKGIQDRLDVLSSVVGKYSEYWDSIDGSSKHRQPTDYSLRDGQSITHLSGAGTVPDGKSLHFKPIELEPTLHEIYILDAYVQSLLCGRISTRERLTKADIQAVMRLNLPDDLTNPTRKAFLTKVCNAFEAGMNRRSIVITKKGYIGAIPYEAQPDDLVCVLFGCSVPVVLRKRAGQEYLFIGECYLHGFMDSEAIAMQVKGEISVQKFELS